MGKGESEVHLLEQARVGMQLAAQAGGGDEVGIEQEDELGARLLRARVRVRVRVSSPNPSANPSPSLAQREVAQRPAAALLQARRRPVALHRCHDRGESTSGDDRLLVVQLAV